MIVGNPNEFRTNVAVRAIQPLLYIDDSLMMSHTIEEGVYNYSIRIAIEHDIASNWSNEHFVELYCTRLRSIMSNLKNSVLQSNIDTGKVVATDIENMSVTDLCPDKWTELIGASNTKDLERYEVNVESSSDDFTCKKHNCRSKRCSYYQMQTRSADEPITTFVTCLDCGGRYRC